MNYGYAAASNNADISLAPEDEPERYCAQLYHAVVAQADLQGARVLDVGSGRGGGASYIHRYFEPQETIGCDFAHAAVRFCHNTYAGIAGLEFMQGNAMALPFANHSFDVVLNVESSHCYPNRPAFLREVFRVLRPGGQFLYTDFTPPARDPATEDTKLRLEMAASGFQEVGGRDVTASIVRGLEVDTDRRLREIRSRFPRGTRRAARLWAGTKESWIFRDFQTGARAYMMYRATRPTVVNSLGSVGTNGVGAQHAGVSVPA